MPLYNELIRQLVSDAASKVAEGRVGELKIDYPAESVHGDYASPIALELGKKLKRPPREVAQEIVAALKLPTFIQKTEIAGPGFINFYFSPEFLSTFSAHVIENEKTYGSSEVK